jgi:hypothetical protein
MELSIPSGPLGAGCASHNAGSCESLVSFPQGEQRFRQHYPEWEPLNPQELFVEMQQGDSAQLRA